MVTVRSLVEGSALCYFTASYASSAGLVEPNDGTTARGGQVRRGGGRMDLNAIRLGPTAATRLEVDLDAVAHNVRLLRRCVGPAPRLYASLKADAYGFGLEAIATTALWAGADAVAVGSPDDALRLRRLGVMAPILVYHAGVPDRDRVRALERAGVAVTVVDSASVEGYASGASHRIDVFVKVDAGLHRLGTAPEAALDLLELVSREPRLQLRGIYTHLHAPDDAEQPYLDWQYTEFVSIVERARTAGFPVETAMAASSGVLVHGAGMVLDAVDPGRLLYGLGPLGRAVAGQSLRPALSALKTRLIQVRTVPARTVHADLAPFPLSRDTRVGVIPMGRWQGLDRATSGFVLVRGRRVPLLGTISIEHCRLDLTGVPEAEPGDEVVVIGSQGREAITLEEVGAATRWIAALDVMLATGGRVDRGYIGGPRGGDSLRGNGSK
jgi:alanine racemase